MDRSGHPGWLGGRRPGPGPGQGRRRRGAAPGGSAATATTHQASTIRLRESRRERRRRARILIAALLVLIPANVFVMRAEQAAGPRKRGAGEEANAAAAPASRRPRRFGASSRSLRQGKAVEDAGRGELPARGGRALRRPLRSCVEAAELRGGRGARVVLLVVGLSTGDYLLALIASRRHRVHGRARRASASGAAGGSTRRSTRRAGFTARPERVPTVGRRSSSPPAAALTPPLRRSSATAHRMFQSWHRSCHTLVAGFPVAAAARAVGAAPPKGGGLARRRFLTAMAETATTTSAHGYDCTSGLRKALRIVGAYADTPVPDAGKARIVNDTRDSVVDLPVRSQRRS